MRLRRTTLASTIGILLIVLPCLAWAGTTGKIAGKVTDPEGGAIVAATLRVEGTPRGAYSGGEGEFTILQVPPGVYEVSCKRLGFEPVLVREVRVSADETTRLDITMGEATIEMEEVVVTAERPPVDLGLTSSKATVSVEEIEELPVQDLDEIVNLQAGVVDGHVRGGRQGEVQYQVDGVSVNNAFDNSSTVKLDRSLLQEVQVISGTFDAEYGQAMSGVVNAVLKSGTPEFEWGGEMYSGDQVYPGADGRIVDDEFKPAAIRNFQLHASGPLPIPDTLFLVSGRRYHFDDYVYAERRYATIDNDSIATQVPGDLQSSGDGGSEPLSYTREWSGVAKVSNTSLENAKLSYQIIFNRTEGQRNDWAFRFHPDGQTTQRNTAVAHGLDWTQTLSATSYFDFSVRQNYRKYTDWAYEDAFDPRYDEAGGLATFLDSETGLSYFVGGVSLSRYQQLTNSWVFKGSYTNQVDPVHLVKAGFELELPTVEFGTPGYLVFNQEGGTETLQRFFDQPPDFPGIDDYHPMIGALYAQDSMEWEDLTLRAGLRFDYFHARANLPSDLRNPANAIEGAPRSVPQATTAKVALSPRLGVAYPIEDYASIHFAYGHFRQFPAIGTIFNNSNYGTLATLQAGTSYAVYGNPDVEPEKTVQYEVGYKHALTQDFGFELTTFYKDIRDLLGVEFVTTYTAAQYARLTNVDFGNVFGFTLALDHRKLGPASVSIDYTWQQALGNTSDPQETANRAANGEDARPRLIPFNWDQRHTLNATASIGSPQTILFSSIAKLASGQPYTPAIDRAGDTNFTENTGRKPLSFLLDLRAEKDLATLGQPASLFARVFNVFDTRFFNGAVFETTGSPYYTRNPGAFTEALNNPLRYYSPRRIEVGIRYGF